MVSLASHDGQPPRTQAFSGVGMDGPEDFALRLGTHSDRSAGLGFHGLAKGEKSQADAEAKRMGKPQNADVCSGGGICTDFAVVDSGRSAFGQDYVHLCDPSGTAGAGFLDRDPGCLRLAVRQFGNTGHAARPWQSTEHLEPGSNDAGAGFDGGGMVADVG